MKELFLGKISKKILSLLNDQYCDDIPVFLGESNIKHMQSKHPEDYAKYGMYISEIVTDPDYIGLNPKDQSIECVKEFLVDGEYVKVAVRTSTGGKHFARSLYVLNKKRVRNFIVSGALKKTR